MCVCVRERERGSVCVRQREKELAACDTRRSLSGPAGVWVTGLPHL